ncbi:MULTISPECIES: hypothetical protein [Streptosporangium]|uniref:Uncharacterized protein n=1 Tax=Streptosporangium brasiliense TaxID=47480 RepID=A0ABT9R9R9_9ACTN|nr:hypothetical protein [Streptosporangium brasiliense]MDP9865596.1 hypothetical protein [Streptosporangium brasiliense]
MDELQLYLDHHRGLRPGMVRKLIGSKIPVIIIGTLWPEFYTAYTRDAILNLESNLGFERELMRLAEVVHIGDSLSDRETERARQAAKTDRRIRESLRSHDYGMTQFLAAGPLLIDAWKSADRYASALLHAAISVSLLGIRTPLDLEMIKSVAITNITGRALALAKPDWFDVALSYCTEPLRGAASLLEPVATDLGKITGYKVADYVLQSASMEPRYSRITEGAWQYLATHIVELNDLRRLAQAAEIRLIYSIALPLRRKLSELGRRGDLLALAMLLAKQDQKEDATELLWSNVKPQDYNESLKLADLLIEKRDIERLALLADSGNEHIADELAKWLKSIGNIRDLARRADAGDGKAAEHYYQLLVDQGNIDTLSVYSNSGDKRAEWHLSRLLALQCKLPELRESAEAGKRNARRQLATTLASMGRQEELKSLADAGDLDALGMAARLPEGGKYLRELTDHADRGTQGAAMILVSALMFLDDTETLKKRAANGDVLSGAFLASYLSVKKDKQALEDMVRSGDTIAAFMLGQVLGGEKDLEGLMDLSNVHGSFAAKEVCRILAERGDIDALISNTLAGQYDASQYLIEALEKCGRADDARRLKKYGLTADGDIAERLE